MDTLKIKKNIDTVTVTNKVIVINSTDSIETQDREERTITIEKLKGSNVDYISKTMDFVADIAWPLTLIFIVLLFKRHIVALLTILNKKIGDSKSVKLSSQGVEFSLVDTPLDKATISNIGQSKLPDFKLTDDQSKKILSTLWRHQNEYDKEKNLNTRWSFTLGQESPDFLSFQQAIHRLQMLGIVTINLSNGQYFLTDLGYKYCEQYKDDIGTFSYFWK